MKKIMKNKKGFTMAELLIVVAIIAVLVAIAIPVFTAQLEKSREATDQANIRSAYAEVITDYLANGGASSYSKTISVDVKQKESGWGASSVSKITIGTSIGSQGTITAPAKTSGKYSVKIDSKGKVTVN